MRLQSITRGVVVGTVVSLDDPENLGRIQVRYDFLGDHLSQWARLVVLMGGPNRGTLFRPEPKDEVLLAFELGSPNRPYILGALWSKEDPLPKAGEKRENTKKNDLRLVRSRSGHRLIFNDKEGEETLEIVDKSEKRKIVFDVKNKKIQLHAANAGDEIEIFANQGRVSIGADKGIAVTCEKGDVSVKAVNGTIELEAADVKVSAKNSATITGNRVTIKGRASVTIEGKAIKLN